MRKRVTFVEHLKQENLVKNGSGHILMRSTEVKRWKDGAECFPSQQERELYRGTHANVSAGSQHMKTIQVPKSMMSAPFLQHPALTAGQRRYLCSIANVYSTEHMRQQMKQHYLNVLHSCVLSGQNVTCRRRYGDPQNREKNMYRRDAGKDVEARMKPQLHKRNSSSSSTAHSDVILPKIVKG